MEPQQNQPESLIAPLKQVTPLSKYLAMIIFIVMPFIGGWIGYVHATNKQLPAVVDMLPVEMMASTTEQAVRNFEQSKYSYLPTYIDVTENYDELVSKDFLNIEEFLKGAPFQWEAPSDIRSVKLLSYYPKQLSDNLSDSNSGLCYKQKCESITVMGDAYTKVQLADESSFHIQTMRESLESQGYIFLYEIAKGGQFSETYQKINGNKSHLISISQVSTRSGNSSLPSTLEIKYEVFVSVVFENPADS